MKNYIQYLNDTYTPFKNYLKKNNYSSIFILVDSQTKKYCLPLFLEKANINCHSITIPSGEKNKNINTCNLVWEKLSEKRADRKSLLINLGGGVITDLGGFIASTFKRGLDFIHIPTSLLAMVDAAIGGKTGVDLNALKNQIGTISLPKKVFIDSQFLETLQQKELFSGYAEMLKHGLISKKSIKIKSSIVAKDPYEKGQRKILNFGHTFGHAIETFYLESKTKPSLSHGYSIVIGMILESFLSTQCAGLKMEIALEIKKYLLSIYPALSFNKKEIQTILNLLQHDKKNEKGVIQFVLLKDWASPKINVSVPQKYLLEAFNFYHCS